MTQAETEVRGLKTQDGSAVSSTLESRIQRFCCLESPSLWNFVTAAVGNLYTRQTVSECSLPSI